MAVERAVRIVSLKPQSVKDNCFGIFFPVEFRVLVTLSDLEFVICKIRIRNANDGT